MTMLPHCNYSHLKFGHHDVFNAATKGGTLLELNVTVKQEKKKTT